MKYTPKIQKAISVSAEKHLGQKRKNTGKPFVVHPFSVAFILSEYTKDEDLIVAGLLHDVLEDTKGYTFLDMKKDFGLRVAEIVRELSEDKAPYGIKIPKLTWKLRKSRALQVLKNSNQDVMIVCAADKIHNLRSIEKNYKEQGNKIWKKFNASPEKKFWYYEEVIKILKKKIKGKMIKELEDVFNRVVRAYKKNNNKKTKPNNILEKIGFNGYKKKSLTKSQ